MTDGKPPPDRQAGRRLRAKNWALAITLVAFVVLIYLVSIVRMGSE